jgi:hypothetical protein
MLIIPLIAVPSQKLSVPLANQTCQINVYQKAYGLFMDLYVNNSLIIGGVLCHNLNRIVRSLYLGFIGDFVFYDTQVPVGEEGSDPVYTGLGARYQLIYLEVSDLNGAG